ncbi:hypothetical protein DNTS_016528 [Danionella cerebrum]|uniref:Uncharacterized protein n=1 Tax=Danionella cerebrum TaxID=2873325 RepID=A0A553RAW5_9TELE|nr:hypothetical protein DNTS_016528 [Danionella translucida]
MVEREESLGLAASEDLLCVNSNAKAVRPSIAAMATQQESEVDWPWDRQWLPMEDDSSVHTEHPQGSCRQTLAAVKLNEGEVCISFQIQHERTGLYCINMTQQARHLNRRFEFPVWRQSWQHNPNFKLKLQTTRGREKDRNRKEAGIVLRDGVKLISANPCVLDWPPLT